MLQSKANTCNIVQDVDPQVACNFDSKLKLQQIFDLLRAVYGQDTPIYFFLT